MTHPARAVALRYGGAILSVSGALTITVLTHFYSPPPRFVSHFVLIAIALTFWFAGTGPGLLALLLSCFGVTVLARHHYLTPDFPLVSFLSFFVIFSSLLILFSESQRRAQRLLREARDTVVGLEARMNERTRIARELHDTLLQSLHGLLFRFQAAKNLLPRSPAEAMEALDGAIARTEQAITESQDAITDLRPAPADQSDLGGLLMATGKELETAGNTDGTAATFGLTVEGERKSLSPILQAEVHRIARELLRNAFRHACAHRVEAEVRYGDEQLRVRIRDDGKGMDPEVLKRGRRPGHWGLLGAKERAQRIGAQLDIWSEAGAGTEVQLIIPAAMAYKNAHDRPRLKFFRRVRVDEQRF